LPAHGRADVDSKWTADQKGGFNIGQGFQLRVHASDGLLAHLHLADSEKQTGLVRGDLEWQNHAAKFALGNPVEEAGKQTCLVRFDTADARHRFLKVILAKVVQYAGNLAQA
jgi:hypothetical protein